MTAVITVVREICIFMIVAQAILFFVPGSSYMKYVRVLIGIIMIMKITEPLLSALLDDEKKQEIRERMAALEQKIDEAGREVEIGDGGMDLYESIEEEIKRRLERCDGGCRIVSVRFSEAVYSGKEGEGGEDIIVTVSEKDSGPEGTIRVEPVRLGEAAPEELHEEELKKMYGDCIGVDADRIKIVVE